MPASWLVVLGEKLCTRLAVSSAQSCWLLIPQCHSGFSMSSDTSASKSLQRVALAPCNLDHVHSWTQCFTWCSRWRWQQHKLPSPEKPSAPSDGAPSHTSSHFYQCSPHFAKWKCMLNKSTYTYSSDPPRARRISPFFFFSKMRSQNPKSTFQMQLQGLHNWNFFSNLITSFRQFLTSGDYKWEFVVNIAKKKVPLMFLQCIQSSLGMSRENSFLFHLKCHYVH